MLASRGHCQVQERTAGPSHIPVSISSSTPPSFAPCHRLSHHPIIQYPSRLTRHKGHQPYQSQSTRNLDSFMPCLRPIPFSCLIPPSAHSNFLRGLSKNTANHECRIWCRCTETLCLIYQRVMHTCTMLGHTPRIFRVFARARCIASLHDIISVRFIPACLFSLGSSSPIAVSRACLSAASCSADLQITTASCLYILTLPRVPPVPSALTTRADRQYSLIFPPHFSPGNHSVKSPGANEQLPKASSFRTSPSLEPTLV